MTRATILAILTSILFIISCVFVVACTFYGFAKYPTYGLFTVGLCGVTFLSFGWFLAEVIK